MSFKRLSFKQIMLTSFMFQTEYVHVPKDPHWHTNQRCTELRIKLHRASTPGLLAAHSYKRRPRFSQESGNTPCNFIAHTGTETGSILVPRGRDPFGQRQESRPLAGSMIQHRKSAIHGHVVNSGISEWLKIQHEPSAHVQKIGSARRSRSRFLVLTKQIVGSGDENRSGGNRNSPPPPPSNLRGTVKGGLRVFWSKVC